MPRLVDQIAAVVKTSTAPLRNRLANVVSRMVVDAVNDAAQRQGLRVLGRADEVLDEVEHFQPGGLSHVALPGADGVLLCVGGVRAHPVAMGVANTEARPVGLQPGETALYTASQGTAGVKVHCTAADEVRLAGADDESSYVALASKVDARLSALHNFWSALSGTTPLTATALKGLYTATFPTTPDSVAASKVRAQ